MRTRVKICGLTRPEDVAAAVACGVDAIGLVFAPGSPRRVGIAQAAALRSALPPFVAAVAVFVDPDADLVRAVLREVCPDLLQFHGDEAPDFCAGYGRPYVKAVRMREGVDLGTEARRHRRAQGLLLDAYVEGVAGGTGTAFDWSRAGAGVGLPIVLAGGLTPDNIARAIAAARPFAVDVSGGVERDRGVKDAAKIEAFMSEVRRADAE